MNVCVSTLSIILKSKDLAGCTVLVFFCSVERDTHQYFLLDQTSLRGTSKHSLSETQEQS